MKIKIMTATLMLLCTLPRPISAADEPAHKLPDGAIFFHPKDSVPEWSIPPGLLKKLKDKHFSFNVAPNGKICLASDRILFYPELPLTLTTKVPIQEFTWLAEGNMLVHSGQSLGFLNTDLDDEKETQGGKKKGPGILSFSSRFTLPYKKSRLYPGLGDFFYLVGRNEKENRNEISAWNLSDDKIPARPLYATTVPISAVAGSPEKTYFATGPEVFVLEKGETIPKSIYINEREDIRELIYRPDAGLFFTTGNSAGYIGAKVQLEFLTYPGVELRLRGNALYVRLGPVGNGIMKITGPEHFADLRLDPKK